MRKQILSIMLSLTMAMGLMGANVSYDAKAATATTNIAYGKQTYPSSVNGNNVGANAVDGDSSTYWQAQRGTNELIVINLGRYYNVDYLSIDWGEQEGLIEYEVYWEGATGGMNLAVTWGGTGYITGEEGHMMYGRPIRQIMIRCKKSDPKYNMTIHNISVSGTLVPGQDDPFFVYGRESTNVSQGKTAFASSSENQVFVPENVLDGDVNTRWSSAFEDNQSITIDLEDKYMITGINLNWETAYASNYIIYFSKDGQTWTDAGTYEIDSAGVVSHPYANGSYVARYIKIQGNTRATQYGISLFEVEVLGYN